MDGVTQTLLGAAVGQAAFARRLGRAAPLVGGVAGALADADAFLRVPSDPMLSLHRHFTHALAFIPVGGLVAALPFLLVPSLRRRFALVLACATLAYATHAPLDACTSTGVLLLLPFSDARVAWDVISFIDPAFTLPLLVGVAAATVRRSPGPARVAVAVAVAYLAVGVVQRERAQAVQRELARRRGDAIAHGRVIPTIGSDVVWRSVYRDREGRLHADAVRLPWFGAATVREGEVIRAFDATPLLRPGPRVPRPERLVRDLRRYHHRTEGLWAALPDVPGVVADMRISLDPAGFEPIWGIRIDPEHPEHPVLPARGLRARGRASDAWGEIIGRDPRHRPVWGAPGGARDEPGGG